MVIGYRRPHDRSDPPLGWTDADGRRAGVANPLAEFPEADDFSFRDVAAGPQSVLVSGIVQAGEKALRLPPRHVILTYDLNGALRRKWVTNPFYFRQIAVDHAGNVYGLGVRLDGVRVANLVRKYSADGAVQGEFFPSVYMADSDELFEFDLDGKLQRRTSLHEPLARLARDHHGARAEIVTLAGNPRAVSEIAEVRIWTQGDEDVSPALVRLFLDGRRPQTLEAADGTALATASFPLLGTIGDEVLFLNRYTATLLRR